MIKGPFVLKNISSSVYESVTKRQKQKKKKKKKRHIPTGHMKPEISRKLHLQNRAAIELLPA